MTHSACITIGNFDGVHLGHRSLIRLASEIAAAQNLDLIILTFWPHPREILQGHGGHRQLASREDRLALLAQLGAKQVLEIPFTTALASLEPQGFIEKYLLPLNMAHLVIGHDFTLGKGRAGNFSTLSHLADRCGFGLTQAPPFCIDHAPVSSTSIRSLISTGDVRDAARLLGRPYAISGKITHGFQRGQELGYPTANLAESDQLVPGHGVYATWAEVDGKKYKSVTNIGYNPTFNGQRLSIESFLLDTHMDMYGEHMELQFVERIRPERRFGSAAELVRQIDTDVAQARALLS